MGVFDFLKSKKDQKTLSREEILDKNENVPFTVDLPTTNNDNIRAYYYESVKCKITGDVSGLKQGAVLYIRKGGVLANVARENIAIIENQKIVEMVNNFFDNDAFCTVSARFVCVKDEKVFCNIAFYREKMVLDQEEEGA